MAKLRPTENQVAQAILDWLRVRGWRVHRLEADVVGPKAKVKREEVGTPDYLAIKALRHQYADSSAGRADYFYLEVKRPGGKLRTSQRIWIDDARKRGWRVCVASSVEDVQTFLEGRC